MSFVAYLEELTQSVKCFLSQQIHVPEMEAVFLCRQQRECNLSLLLLAFFFFLSSLTIVWGDELALKL